MFAIVTIYNDTITKITKCKILEEKKWAPKSLNGGKEPRCPNLKRQPNAVIADDEGFEPTDRFQSPVFKTGSIDHLDNHPAKRPVSIT